MVKRTERGWAGHFCAAQSCMFRRNTLLQSETESIVVSTVGNYRYNGAIREIGCNRYYETMAFHSLVDDKRYHDADVGKQIYFNSQWSIAKPDADDLANDMHEKVVAEITELMATRATQDNFDAFIAGHAAIEGNPSD